MNSDPGSLIKNASLNRCYEGTYGKKVLYNGNIEHAKLSRKVNGGWEDWGGALWQL